MSRRPAFADGKPRRHGVTRAGIPGICPTVQTPAFPRDLDLPLSARKAPGSAGEDQKAPGPTGGAFAGTRAGAGRARRLKKEYFFPAGESYL